MGAAGTRGVAMLGSRRTIRSTASVLGAYARVVPDRCRTSLLVMATLVALVAPLGSLAQASTSNPSLLLRDIPAPAAARERVGGTSDGFITLQGVRIAVGPKGQVEWSDKAGRGRSFQRWLHAHLIVADLAVLAREGDAEAGRLGMAIVDHWVAANPRHRPADPMAWHDETTALRTRHLLTLHEVVTGTDRARLETLLRSHVQLLLDDSFHRAGTNHGMFQDRAILAWASSPAASGSLRTTATATATRRLLAYFDGIVSPDGVHLEHSPAYHQVIFANLNRFHDFYTATGDVTTASRLAKVRASLLRYATHVLQPDGSFPMVGDTMTVNVPTLRLSADPHYRFAVTAGREGTAPVDTDAFFPHAGYAIMRDRWAPGPGGTYLHFTAAYHNRYHKHADDLSVWLYHHGELLTEAGAHGYEFGTPFVNYGYGASSHNTVLVDGAGIPAPDGRTSAVKLLSAARSGAVSTASGQSGRLPHGTWQRDLRYDRAGATVTVTDRVALDRSRALTLLWHTAPGVTTHVSSGGEVTLARKGVIAARMRVTTEAGTVVSPTIKRGARSPYAGWRLGGGTPTPVDTMSFRHSGRQARFVTQIRLADQPPPPLSTAAVCRVSTAAPFPDVSGAHAAAITCAHAAGIVTTPAGASFRPERAISRADLTSMLARTLTAAGIPLPAAPEPGPFADLSGRPDADTIAAMHQAGIVNGTGPGRFDPQATITRAQAASLLARTLEYATDRPLADGPSYFRDVGGVHGLPIRQITRAGLAAGDGRLGFDPNGTLSRAQAATFSVRLLASIDGAT
jgi:hypothetical protein